MLQIHPQLMLVRVHMSALAHRLILPCRLQLIHGLPPPTPPPTTVGSSVAQALNAVEHIEEVSASDKADKTVAVVVEDEDEAGNTSDEGYRTHSSGMATAAAGN